MDKLVTKRLTNYIERYGILQEPQYGFRQGRGTTDQMLTVELLAQIQEERGEQFHVMLIDL